MTAFADRLDRGAREWGDKWDPEALWDAPDLVWYYNTNERVEVDVFGDGTEILRGRISTTTGWKPTFLLMRRTSDHGSMWTLDARTKVLRVVR